MPKKCFTVVIVVMVLVQSLTSCAPRSQVTVTAKPKVITTLFPQYDFAREIAGDKVEVSLLLPPGVESHSYEPSPRDIVEVQNAAVFIYTGKYMEPWADKIVQVSQGKSLLIVDASHGIELMAEHDPRAEHDDVHHDEHEHDHEHSFEWAGAFELEKGDYKLSFSKVNGAYADPVMAVAVLFSQEHGHESIEDSEEDAEGLFASEPAPLNVGGSFTPGQALYELQFDQAKDSSTFSLKIEQSGTYVFFSAHLPSEFESGTHFFKDNAGKDVLPVAHEPEGDDHSHDHGGYDPHIWLDPINALKMVDNIVSGLAQADPKNGDLYKSNGELYKQKLQSLDSKLVEMFAQTQSKKIIYAGHFAFGYLAKRYGLEHVSPYRGFAPDAEPTPQRIAELIKTVDESNTKVIYYEELVGPKVANVISEQTGAKMLLLHGAHNISKEDLSSGLTYLQIMEGNLQKLREGLGLN